MNRSLCLIAVFCFLCLSFSSTVLAQEKGMENSTIASLEEMVVTAGRTPEPKKGIPANVTVIDSEAIEQSTAVDLGELLAQNGLDVRQYPGTSTQIAIRGFRTDSHGNDLKGKVLILLDGRRAGTGNAAKIMTKNVERVEIIRGPASVQYGSAAVGGVVNIITKRGTDDLTAFVEGYIGSFDAREASVGLAGEVNGFDYSGSFTTGSIGDYTTADGDVYKNTGIDGKENVSINLGYTMDERHRVGVIFNSVDVDESGSPDPFAQNDLDDYSDKSNYSTDLSYGGKTDDENYSWFIRYFFGKDEDKWVSPVASNPNGFDDGIDTVKTVDAQGAQAQLTSTWGPFQMTAGMDWLDYEVSNRYDPKESTYENIAGFVLGKLTLLDDRFTVSAGARYDRYEVEMIDPTGKTEDDGNLTPNVGVAFLFTDWLKVRAAYSEAFVMPSADHLAADYTAPAWGGGNTTYVGNPDLKPESSRTYEGGVDLAWNALSGALTYFHTDYKDKIESVTIATSTKSWENLGKSRITGLEAEFGWDLAQAMNWGFSLRPYVSLTWLTEYKDRETGEDLKYTPDFMASYGIALSNLDGFSCRLNMTYTGEKEVDDWINYTGVFTQKSHTVADLSLSQVLVEGDNWGTISMDAGIRNLFNESYNYVNGYPMPERNFYLGVRFTY